MSKRSSLLGSHPYAKDGFQKIPDTGNSMMAGPNDAMVNIPLTSVSGPNVTRDSNENASQAPPYSQSSDEKSAFFKRTAGNGRRRRTGDGVRGTNAEGARITSMGRFYNKVMDFSIVTRYFVYVLPLALMIAVPIVVGAVVAKTASVGGVRIVWIFTWLEIVWLSLWISKLFAKFLPYVFQFLCGIVSSGTRKYALVLRALENPITLVGWATTCVATFAPLMQRNPDNKDVANPLGSWEPIVQNVLGAFVVGTLVFLMQKFVIQLISMSYHRMQYDLKIKESKQNVHLLSILYDASRALFPAFCPEFAEEDYLINDSIDVSLGGSHQRSGSVTPMRLLQNVGRMGDKITAAFGNVAQEIIGKQVFNPTSAHSIVVEALEKSRSSEALAKRIWMSFVVEGKEALYQEDILEVLGNDRQEDAAKSFASLDQDGNGDISLDEMILAVCECGHKRKAIASSLHDVDQAIDVLDTLLATVCSIIVVFVFVAFLNSSFSTTLATAGTALLSLSFVFAVTAQEVLGSCIFIFVKHPFDVGDRVDISGEQLIVERMSLLFTIFRKVDDHRNTQVPNIALNGLWIDNISRSGAMREKLAMYISFDTKIEDIELLRNEIQAFVLEKENCRDFHPEIEVEVVGIGSMDKLELRVEVRHKSNWANDTIRAARRSKFMCALVLAVRKVPIYAPGGGCAVLGSADQPTYSVSVSDTQAAARRDAFSRQKAESHVNARLEADDKALADVGISSGSNFLSTSSATRPRHDSNFASPSETAALASLNARRPTVESIHDPESGINSPTLRNPTSPTDSRAGDVEEVRNMLRRQSTRGKRHADQVSPRFSDGRPTPGVPTITEPSNGTYYDQYATSAATSTYRGNDSYGGPPKDSYGSAGMSLPLQGTSGDGFGASMNMYAQQAPRYEPPPQNRSLPTPPTAQTQAQKRTAPSSSRIAPPLTNQGPLGHPSESRRPEKNNSFATEME